MFVLSSIPQFHGTPLFMLSRTMYSGSIDPSVSQIKFVAVQNNLECCVVTTTVSLLQGLATHFPLAPKTIEPIRCLEARCHCIIPLFVLCFCFRSQPGLWLTPCFRNNRSEYAFRVLKHPGETYVGNRDTTKSFVDCEVLWYQRR